MILNKIVADVQKRLAETKAAVPLEIVREQAFNRTPTGNLAFLHALQKTGISIISEVKKGSPSKGIIDPAFDYKKIALEYDRSGAAAISVLTERDHFFGAPEYLREIKSIVSIPVLRKDFIIDPYQIYEAALLGADAILLIAAILDTEQLACFHQLAKDLGMDTLMEAHNKEELDSVLAAGGPIVGINNRDLKTFKVDIHNTIRLRERIPAGKTVVSESGIQTAEDIKKLKAIGVDAVLVGEAFMRLPDKKELFRELKQDD